MIRAFKLLPNTGDHHHLEGAMRNPVIYGRSRPAGDTVLTSMDLVKKFPNKFTEVAAPAASAAPVSTEQTEEKPAATSKTGGKPGSESKTETVDVTEQFPGAAAVRFLVFQKGEGYWVADSENPAKFANKKALKKDEVEKYVTDLV